MGDTRVIKNGTLPTDTWVFVTGGTISCVVVGRTLAAMARSALGHIGMIEDGTFPGYAGVFVAGSTIAGVVAVGTFIFMT